MQDSNVFKKVAKKIKAVYFEIPPKMNVVFIETTKNYKSEKKV